MNPEAKALIDAMRAILPAMTDEERSDVVATMMEGYCQNCGSDRGYIGCQCLNDE